MSECQSISGSEITESSNYSESSECDSFHSDEYVSGSSTIPLHHCLRRENTNLITQENYKTFIQTPESVMESVLEWGPSIMYVRDEFITYELCKIAVTDNEHSICSIKPHLLSKEEYYNLCLIAATENGSTIKEIPHEVQTQELCDAGIKSICWAIKYTLDKYKTYENCLSATRRNGQTMEFVPKQFIDKQMCVAAANSRYPCLNLIPEELLTKEIYEMAVRGNGENVKWVPDEFMSIELAHLAINSPAPNNGSNGMCASNIQYIKAPFLTKEIIVDSAKRSYYTYGRIPKECITEDVEEAVLEVSPYCITFMEQTPERCIKAFKMEPWIIRDCLKVENITRELVEEFEALPIKINKNIKRWFKKEDLEKIMSLLDR